MFFTFLCVELFTTILNARALSRCILILVHTLGTPVKLALVGLVARSVDSFFETIITNKSKLLSININSKIVVFIFLFLLSFFFATLTCASNVFSLNYWCLFSCFYHKKVNSVACSTSLVHTVYSIDWLVRHLTSVPQLLGDLCSFLCVCEARTPFGVTVKSTYTSKWKP